MTDTTTTCECRSKGGGGGIGPCDGCPPGDGDPPGGGGDPPDDGGDPPDDGGGDPPSDTQPCDDEIIPPPGQDVDELIACVGEVWCFSLSTGEGCQADWNVSGPACVVPDQQATECDDEDDPTSTAVSADVCLLFTGAGTVTLSATMGDGCQCPGESDDVEITVVELNIDTDSENDGDIDEEDDELEHHAPGRFIMVNDDDDNRNAVADHLDSEGMPEENDLVRMNMTVQADSDFEWELAVADNLKIWANPDRSEPIETGVRHALPAPSTVYVEATQSSAASGDATVAARLWFIPDNREVCVDLATFTCVGLSIVVPDLDDTVPNEDQIPLPPTEGLNVSNNIPNDGFGEEGFADLTDDPDDFRIQIENAGHVFPAPIRVTVSTRTAPEQGATIESEVATLSEPEDEANNSIRWRSPYLRLVTGEGDQGIGVSGGERKKLLRVMELGNWVQVDYEPKFRHPTTNGVEEAAILTRTALVGRPSAGQANGWNQRQHDVRSVVLNIVVFKKGNGAISHTQGEIENYLVRANERFAQSALRIEVGAMDLGPNDGGHIINGTPLEDGFQPTELDGDILPSLNNDELFLIGHKDNDPNSIDVFFVEDVQAGNVAIAYIASVVAHLNNAAAARNWVIIDAEAKIFTLPHEIMHILLNQGHRLIGEPPFMLFRPTNDDDDVFSTKRIGPMIHTEQGGNNVGHSDTFTIRQAAENLPQ